MNFIHKYGCVYVMCYVYIYIHIFMCFFIQTSPYNVYFYDRYITKIAFSKPGGYSLLCAAHYQSMYRFMSMFWNIICVYI